MFTEKQKEYIKELEYYVTSEETLDIRPLIAFLVEEFPAFYYQGIGYRALRDEWNDSVGFNFSWSLDFESAVEACESFSALRGNIYVYEAQIKGFDLDLFVRDYVSKGAKFSPNFISFALREKEILVLNYKHIAFVDEINKIF